MIDFLNSMISNVEQENIELYKEVIKSNKIEKFDNPEDFYFAVLYPWKNFIRGYLKLRLTLIEILNLSILIMTLLRVILIFFLRK